MVSTSASRTIRQGTLYPARLETLASKSGTRRCSVASSVFLRFWHFVGESISLRTGSTLYQLSRLRQGRLADKNTSLSHTDKGGHPDRVDAMSSVDLSLCPCPVMKHIFRTSGSTRWYSQHPAPAAQFSPTPATLRESRVSSTTCFVGVFGSHRPE